MLDIVVAITAVAAFLLSLYNFIVERRDKQPRVRVKIGIAIIQPVGLPGKIFFHHQITNIGHQPLIVEQVGLRFWQKFKRKEMTILNISTQDGRRPPIALQPGEKVVLLGNVDEFIEQVGRYAIDLKRPVRGVVWDTADKKHVGNMHRTLLRELNTAREMMAKQLVHFQ